MSPRFAEGKVEEDGSVEGGEHGECVVRDRVFKCRGHEGGVIVIGEAFYMIIIRSPDALPDRAGDE